MKTKIQLLPLSVALGVFLFVLSIPMLAVYFTHGTLPPPWGPPQWSYGVALVAGSVIGATIGCLVYGDLAEGGGA